MSNVITPSIGRVLWYWPSADFKNQVGAQPNAVLVAYVHSDRMVNVGGFDAHGGPFSQTSVPLVQPGENPPATGPFTEWMPFQIKSSETLLQKAEGAIGTLFKAETSHMAGQPIEARKAAMPGPVVTGPSAIKPPPPANATPAAAQAAPAPAITPPPAK